LQAPNLPRLPDQLSQVSNQWKFLGIEDNISKVKEEALSTFPIQWKFLGIQDNISSVMRPYQLFQVSNRAKFLGLFDESLIDLKCILIFLVQ